MPLPYFYAEGLTNSSAVIDLEEDTSRHIAQVLRMVAGEKLQITDGKGNLHTAEILEVYKKSTQVSILSSEYVPASTIRISIGISLVKNASRFEWFLEKATEIGVNQIIPLLCERTEKHHFRSDRMKGILVSAMLQSRQCWLPVLSDPLPMIDNLPQFVFPQKFIAYCEDDQRHAIKDVLEKDKDALILVGPEGDFSRKEIDEALLQNFRPVTLGETRLRTETAGLVAVCLFKNLL